MIEADTAMGTPEVGLVLTQQLNWFFLTQTIQIQGYSIGRKKKHME